MKQDPNDPERMIMDKPRKNKVSKKSVDDHAFKVKDFQKITAIRLADEITEKALDGYTA